MQPSAIIDLGSNTFHLLIATLADGKVTEVYRQRVFVGLGDGGIDVLKEDAIVRGLETLIAFRNILDQRDCKRIRIMGTAALRTASNSKAFTQPAEEILRQAITIIDGTKEAELIYKGISLITDFGTGNHLIMDIGGGSTEFILVQNGIMTWSNSYKLGVGVMHSEYHLLEPIGYEAAHALGVHIRSLVVDMAAKLKGVNIDSIIGASGSFEVMETMSGLAISMHSNSTIALSTANDTIIKVIEANMDQRLAMPGLPAQRAKLIVVAMILIREIIDLVRPQSLIVSPYALKEGVLFEISNE